MSRNYRLPAIAFVAGLLFAAPLFAQNNSQRDHTVFHRPPSGTAAQKHSSMQSGGPNFQHRGAAPAPSQSAHNRQAPASIPQSTPDAHSAPSMQLPVTH
jgi:hypothetical protein